MEYATERGLIPERTARNAIRNGGAERWQYEPRSRQNGSQRAVQSASAARQRERERQQGGRSR